MTETYRIALLPGDGIGPDVVSEAVRVLRAVEARIDGLRFETEEFSMGAAEYLKHGDPLPENVFRRLPEFHAILLGAMGLPGVRWPDGVEMTPQLDLRERLDLYQGLRPIYLFHPDDSPLRGRQAGNIDLVFVRESTEGLFSTRKVPRDPAALRATDTMLITRAGAERVIRAAFRFAEGRRRHVTLVDKANVLPSMAFFRQVFDDVAPEFPAIATARVYVDAAALYLVQRPEMFDVVVTENMFGDILSDLGAALVGGMGMAPSADIGDRYAVFQPSHGSAPDIAGQGIANPVATILSAAMMLEWFHTPAAHSGAQMIREAVSHVFSNRTVRTRDMGGSLSTTEMGDVILAALPQPASSHMLESSHSLKMQDS
ncbi:MAG TPA: isocitrate/isopropylmalate dehydrogenase family protein [Bryobacteraceae bacterium]|jgi:3-isopropylmalate dehydrogenase